MQSHQLAPAASSRLGTAGHCTKQRKGGANGRMDGPELSRQGSRHGADYDALLAKGIPRHMLRLAWICSAADPDRAMTFIRNNFDQPLAFWGIDGATQPSDDVVSAVDVSSASPAVSASGPEDDDQPLERARTDSHVEVRRTTSDDHRALYVHAHSQALARMSPTLMASTDVPAGSHLQPCKAQPTHDLLVEALVENATSSEEDRDFLPALTVGDYIDLNITELIACFTQQLDTMKAKGLGASKTQTKPSKQNASKRKACRHGAACRRYDCHFRHPVERTPLCPIGAACRETDKKHRRSYLHPNSKQLPTNGKQKRPSEPRESQAEPEHTLSLSLQVNRSKYCTARISAIAGDVSELSQRDSRNTVTVHVELIESTGPARLTPEIVWLREQLERLLSQAGSVAQKGKSAQAMLRMIMQYTSKVQPMLQQLQVTGERAATLAIQGEELLRRVMFPPFTSSPDHLSALAVGDEVEVLVACEGQASDGWVVGRVGWVEQWAATGSSILSIEIADEDYRKLRSMPHTPYYSFFGMPQRMSSQIPSGAILQRATQRSAANIQTELEPEPEPQCYSEHPCSSAYMQMGGFVMVSLDCRSFAQRCAISRGVIMRRPASLVDQCLLVEMGVPPHSAPFVSTSSSQHASIMRRAEVIAYLPQKGKHVLQMMDSDKHQQMPMHYSADDPELRLVDLASTRCIFDGLKGSCVEPRHVVATLGTHTSECQACTTHILREEMAQFCFADYRVTGDGTHKASPRHPCELCTGCFRDYCAREVKTGQLFVKCPCCSRALQTKEVGEVLDRSPDFRRLVQRIREASVAHDNQDADDQALLAAGLQVRLCPKCNTRIEKNEGCSSMVCYLCGHAFEWSSAKRIRKKPKPTSEPEPEPEPELEPEPQPEPARRREPTLTPARRKSSSSTGTRRRTDTRHRRPPRPSLHSRGKPSGGGARAATASTMVSEEGIPPETKGKARHDGNGRRDGGSRSANGRDRSSNNAGRVRRAAGSKGDGRVGGGSSSHRRRGGGDGGGGR